jgi:ubiquinone/menaquinone biosynthesis C-methylase UbiE
MSEAWDYSSREEFVAYYAEKSIRPEQLSHFRSLRDAILRLLEKRGYTGRTYDVLDIGCNAGGQCSVWAEVGHRAHGLDVNGPLLELARKRGQEAKQDIDYRLGSATHLPWPDQCMDICIATELLEHVADWETCLMEFTRVLRPGGTLLITTTNQLCPRQNEFNLPLYSWYPKRVKRHYARMATTTRPELANHAKYPAVNWFTPYGLSAEFARRGFEPIDRFELVDHAKKGTAAKLVLAFIRALPPVRFLAHCCYAGTTVMGIKL